MEVCLSEIERCQRLSPRPSFLILVGDRYGYRPVPEQIPDTEFRAILQHLPGCEREFLVGRPGQDDASGWYRLDENQVGGGIWRLQGWGTRLSDSAHWTEVEGQLRGLLLKGAACAALPKRRYGLAATHREFQVGVLGQNGSAEQAIAVLRSFRDLPNPQSDVEALNYGDWLEQGDGWTPDPEARSGLVALRTEVQGAEGKQLNRVHRYDLDWSQRQAREYLERFCADIRQGLLEVIEAELERSVRGEPRRLDQQTHEDFLREYSEQFVGRTVELAQLRCLLDHRHGRAIVVSGKAGVGKSAFMARAITLAQAEFPGARVLYRFGGVSSAASDEFSLILTLSNLLSPKPESETGSKYGDLAKTFKDLLCQSRSAEPLFIFVDGLDQLSGPAGAAAALDWIPHSLPSQVHLVVSCLPALKSRLAFPHEGIVLEPMPESEGMELVRHVLANRKRALRAVQENALRAKLALCGLPLYARLLSEIAVQWRSYESPPELPNDLTALIAFQLEALSAPEQHGAMLVSRTMAYLCSSRYGLPEDELVDLLTRDEEVWGELLSRAKHPPSQRKLPMAVWSRLYLDLAPYLREQRREGLLLLGFYHRSVGNVCQSGFLNSEEERRKVHLKLADFFQRQTSGGNIRSTGNFRRLMQVAWHLFQGQSWQQLAETLAGDEMRRSLWMDWDERHEEVVGYWRAIEKNSPFRADEAYRESLNTLVPASFDAVLVTQLMQRLGHFDVALEALERLIRLCRAMDNVSDICDYLTTQAQILGERGDFEGAMAALKEEEAIKRKHWNRDGIIARLKKLGITGHDEVEAVAQSFTGKDAEGSIVPSLGNQALLLERSGDLAGALKLHEQVAEICARNNNREALAISVYSQAEIQRQLGKLDKASDLVKRACDLLREGGQRLHLIGALNLQVELLHQTGKDSAAVIPLQEMVELLRDAPGNSEQLCIAMGRLGETLLSLKRNQEAFSAFLELKAVCDAAGNIQYAERCEGHLAQLARSAALFGEKVHPELDEAVALFREGHDLSEKGKWDEAIPKLEMAEAIFRRLNITWLAREALNRRSMAVRFKGEKPSDDMIRRELNDLIYKFTGKRVPGMTEPSAAERAKYERDLQEWRALPLWKRVITPKPNLPH
jgi:tetratricopeptide (TPR) repeat protein